MDDTQELVILVDAADREIGTAPKLEAHRSGELHRAFSVMLWNDAGEMLLQQRAAGKYHSGGLWANACCGHPRPGEAVGEAAVRRVTEELGVACGLEPIGQITYRADLGGALIEHELVHVFHGILHGNVAADPSEVADVTWIAPDDLSRAIAERPQDFAAWLRRYDAARWPLRRAAKLNHGITAA